MGDRQNDHVRPHFHPCVPFDIIHVIYFSRGMLGLPLLAPEALSPCGAGLTLHRQHTCVIVAPDFLHAP
jgi:hypothetical protein